ncbi:MAG: PSD1 and planctomycete cytochrome C domain-containing protein [Planctomycetaceae bacterium]
MFPHSFRLTIARCLGAARRGLAGGIVLVAAATCLGDDPGLAVFESAIRPVLVQHCYECHSADAEAKGNLEAGLRLDTKQGMLTGGDAGPAVLPGDPENSLLLAALRREQDQMPPSGRLPDAVIDKFAKWIAMGAPDPRDGGSTAPTPRRAAFSISPEDRAHWAFQPLSNSPLPSVQNTSWVCDDIDRFILAKLESSGRRPNDEADKYSLLRRTTFALTGLPPTPAEVQAFIADERDAAFAGVVDRLLASPEFGVHWARHWLDGVRYADSVDASGEYRKWVIRAFNADLPYDEFVRLQIAGDLLPAHGVEPDRVHASGASLDGIIATGMLSLAAWEIVGRDLAVAEIVDSQIDVVGRQLLGLTLSCVRCHDHKFDPIAIEDYYGLAGIFFSSHIVTGKLVNDDRLGNELIAVPLLTERAESVSRGIDADVGVLTQRIASLDRAVPNAARLAAIGRQLPELASQIEKSTSAATKEKLVEQADKLKAEQTELVADQKSVGWETNPPELIEAGRIRDQMKKLQASKPTAVKAVAVLEGGVPGSNRQQIGDAPVYLRGEYQHPGPIVPRRFPIILAGDQQIPIGQRTTASGRRELAEWITSPDHPLTPRVMVNRIWQHLFGQGLVRTPDNFGRLGEPPTHPELLDHLAHRFVSSGWSVKQLVRAIALSATYRQSSIVSPDVAHADPDNRLLGHMNRRRLTYEELRDALSFVAGRLASGTQSSTVGLADESVRTIYEPVDRRQTNVTAAMFDAPDPKAIVPIRAETTTAPQALFLLNNGLAAHSAKAVADGLAGNSQLDSDESRYNQLWLTLFGRPPATEELDEARSFVGRHSWERLVHVLLSTNELVYVD